RCRGQIKAGTINRPLHCPDACWPTTNCWRSKRAIRTTTISYERPEPLDIPTSTSAAVTLDLGEAGCGQLVMEIMFAMRDMTPGQTLLVTAYDPAAAGDIAAWCRMTGNTLMQTISNAPAKQFLLKKGQ